MTKVEKFRDELLGKEFQTNNCGKCFVIDYKSHANVTVMFYEPICVVKCYMQNLRKGQVSNPFYATVYGKGYLGRGKYSNKDIKLYDLWVGMLRRCYSKSFHKKQPTYKDTTICEDWHDFQNFAEWCEVQSNYNFKDEFGKSYQLDKDILVKGNKHYSPETCCFVPQEINTLLTLRGNKRGNLPLGVMQRRSDGKYIASANGFNYLGTYNKREDAFQAYKTFKEFRIKSIAEDWKDRIDTKVYEALLAWEICIDD